MCFSNNIAQLYKMRARKKNLIVWKSAYIHLKTGLAKTAGYGICSEVWWKKGTVVKPHKIRQPLGDGQNCGAGLYFYTKSTRVFSGSNPLIKASVKPEDIIAVDKQGETICCVAAKVLDAPNPDPNQARYDWLLPKMRKAKQQVELEERRMKDWLEMRDEELEALQAIKTELEFLKLLLTT